MKTKKKAHTSEDDKRYVVYTTKTGRTERGIAYRDVFFVKDKAFAVSSSGIVDILPKMAVFTEKAAAEKYLAGQGVKRWVVGETSRHNRVPSIFEAHVVTYMYRGRHSIENGKLSIVRCSDNHVIEDTYGFKSFDTKRQAQRFFDGLVKTYLNDARKSRDAYTKLVKNLKACRVGR